MSKYILALVFILFLFGLSAGCSESAKGPFFWKAEKEGKSIYILGTIHFGVGLEDLQCQSEIFDSLSKADLLWTETDLKRQQELMQTAVGTLMMNPSGHSFNSLSEKSQNFLREKSQGRYSDGKASEGSKEEVLTEYEAVKKLSYFGLYAYIQSLCQIEHKEFLADLTSKRKAKNMDSSIQQLGRQKSIPQNYLDEENYFIELTREQLGKISKEQVEKGIRNYRKNCQQEKIAKVYSQTFDHLEAMISMYKSGRSFDTSETLEIQLRDHGIEEDMINASKDYFRHNFLRKRNKIWLEKLISADEKNMFVAAGLAHFQNPYSVLDSLKKEGFSVKRFNSDCQPK